MKYDSKQLELDLGALRHNRDITFQQYHKVCGAIEMVEAMHKNALEHEAKEEQPASEEVPMELLPELVQQAMKEPVRA